MPRATIEKVSFPSDARGFVIEPVGESQLVLQRNIHVAVSAPGAVRGNHYHEKGTEISVVLGPALVRLREDGEIRDINIAEGEAFRFILPPHVSHAFKNTGEVPQTLIAFNTMLFDPAHPDLIRDHLL